MARKFRNRIDYVSIDAYNVGNVHLEHIKKTNGSVIDGDIDDVDAAERILVQKIKNLDPLLDNISYALCAMADR